jgi:hypothetical protein
MAKGKSDSKAHEAKGKDSENKNPAEPATKEEQIGFHKGSLATLAKERQELTRILQIVEQLMQMHIGALKDAGVDLQKEAETVMAPPPKQKKPIEDIL